MRHQQQKWLVSLLRDWGVPPLFVKVQAFAQAMAALASSIKFNRIITDWDMPGGNGGEFIAKALSLGFLAKSILVISGLEANLLEAHTLGVKVLMKPDLFSGIKAFLQ